MTEQAIGFNRAGYEEHRKIVREVTRRMMNEQPHRARWQQHRGGSGGETIWFEVDEGPICDDYGLLEPYLLVTAKRYTAGCSKIPPYAEADGKYKVYQWCEGDFGAAGSMGGTKGKATLSWPLAGECEAKWMLDFTCHEPECP